MHNEKSEPPYLRKLIDIPQSIVKDLKNLASDSDKTLKVYIEDILIELVREARHRNNAKNRPDEDS